MNFMLVLMTTRLGFYGADALLTFKEPCDIYDYIDQNALTFPWMILRT
jgi:hypothetical protein